jgi:hypothetical protein
MTECLTVDVTKNVKGNPPELTILMCALKDAYRRFPKGTGPPVPGAGEPGENGGCRKRAAQLVHPKKRRVIIFKIGAV